VQATCTAEVAAKGPGALNELLKKDLHVLDPLKTDINEHYDEGEGLAARATAKVAAKGADVVSKELSQTNASDNNLKRPSPLPNERTSKRVKNRIVKKDQHLRQLEEFKAEFGHCIVPSRSLLDQLQAQTSIQHLEGGGATIRGVPTR
jgi:hypothetical protein